MTADRTILGCDVGGTRLRAALVGADGAVHGKEVVPTPPEDPGSLTDMMRGLMDSAGSDVAGAVVGIPGPVSYSEGRPLKLPNLPGWEGAITAERLSDDLGIEVLIANDADLAALGEHRYGAGAGTSDMVYVTSSTGVGAGVIIGGRLLHGNLSLAEVGHTIIDRSSGATLESLASGTALAVLAGEPGESVVARARSGDESAKGLFNQVAENFAIGVYNLVHCFSPEIVVVGGGMSQAGDLLLDPLRAILSTAGSGRLALIPKVVAATGGDDVGLRGSAAYWSDQHKG